MKLLAAVLCLFLLAGCAGKTEEVPETTEATGQSLHVSGHPLESQTSGIMEVFLIEEASPLGLWALGEDVVLSTESGMTLYTGPALREAAQTSTGQVLGAAGDRLFVYDGTARQILTLDKAFSPLTAWDLPEETVGFPGVSPEGNTFYYLQKDGLYLLDTELGSSRVLRDNMAVQSGSVRCLGDGKTLLLNLTDPNGEENTLLVSAEDGQSMEEALFPKDAAALPEGLAVCASPGAFSRVMLLTEEPQRLVTRSGEKCLGFLPDISAAVTGRSTDSGMTLRLYLLSTGICRSEVTLPGVDQARAGCVTTDGKLYILAHSEEAGWLILRWHYDAFPAQNAESCLAPYHDTPTAQEAAQSRAKADELEQAYGLNIRIGEEALALQPWDYTFSGTAPADETDWTLEAVGELLSAFPAGFLSRLQTGWEGFSLCLVPKIQGTPASGSLVSAQGLQFQEDGQYYVVLALAPVEDLRYTLFHEFSHLIDTQVMNRCSAYDDWADLNPQEFAYSLDVNADMTANRQYLTGTNRCFVDYYAMVNPAEDRARIFECAVNPGNGDMFTAPILQQKLRRICTGIREAFDLEDSGERFLWEQYLIRYGE